MNYNQIEAFIDLVESKNYSHTAQRLNVSQPAISQRIAALEKDLDCQLIERQADELMVTKAGQYLYDRGKSIIRDWDEIVLAIQKIKDQPQGNLRIGASTVPAQFFISPMIKAFKEAYPYIQIQVQVAGTQKIMQELNDKKIDIAFIGSLPEGLAPNPCVNSKDDKGQKLSLGDIDFIPVASDSLELIVSKDHEWAHRKSVTITELGQAVHIMRESDSGTRKILAQHLAQHGLDVDRLDVLGEFGSTDAVISAVENNLGLAFISNFAAERALDGKKIKTIKVDGLLIERSIYCALNRRQHSLAADNFLNFIV